MEYANQLFKNKIHYLQCWHIPLYITLTIRKFFLRTIWSPPIHRLPQRVYNSSKEVNKKLCFNSSYVTLLWTLMGHTFLWAPSTFLWTSLGSSCMSLTFYDLQAYALIHLWSVFCSLLMFFMWSELNLLFWACIGEDKENWHLLSLFWALYIL